MKVPHLSAGLWISLACVMLLAAWGFAQPSEHFADKIAFLRGESVWLANRDGLDAVRLTDSTIRINDFLFSPELRYLAYSSIVGSAEEPGLWDSTESPPEQPVCSIVILDLTSHRTLGQTDSGWVYINRWLPHDRLLYHRSDGFEVGDSYIYDVHGNSVTNIGMAVDRAWNSDFSRDASVEFYVDTRFVDNHDRYSLHRVDLGRNRDSVIFSRDFPIYDQKISHGNDKLAFIQVEEAGHKYYDIVWLYDIAKSSAVALYRGPSNPKSAGVNALAWSPDDAYLGMFFPGRAIVLDVREPSKSVTVSGTHCSWMDNATFIYGGNGAISLYDMRKNSSRLILTAADQPVFLRMPSK